MIPIYVKLLSGDVVEILLNKEVTYHGLYQEVYDALPEGVYPDAMWQMTLTRQMEDGEYEEVPDTEEKANPQEGEMFCAYMETRWIELEKELSSRSYDAYLDDPTAVSEKDWLYTRCSFHIHIHEREEEEEKEKERVVRDYVLYHYDSGRYYLSRSVEGEWMGRFNEEFLFRFTEETEGFATREEMMDAWLSRWEGYTCRTKAYLKREWMEMFIEWDEKS